jgi:hypothetical protein
MEEVVSREKVEPLSLETVLIKIKIKKIKKNKKNKKIKKIKKNKKKSGTRFWLRVSGIHFFFLIQLLQNLD